MIGFLTDLQIDALLRKQIVGRVGFISDNRVHIVPISYAYDGNNIFAHTYEGEKINAMRSNPEVCFEIDDLRDMANWKSVITYGTFEEITEPHARQAALTLLLARPLPVVSSVTTHLGKNWPFADEIENIDGIVFRIELLRRTGKFESTTDSPLFSNG
jgi:uncharacterized protein